jgi:hypothetical protein
MGNLHLISEKETIFERLPDLYMDEKDLCIWEYKDACGNVHDVTGSCKKLVRQFMTVHKTKDSVISKHLCDKVPLNIQSESIAPVFINVRKSVITRIYERSDGNRNNIQDSIIAGDYQGKSYNITAIYNTNTH